MAERTPDPNPRPSLPSQSNGAAPKPVPTPGEREIGGPKGPEPTRFGDWEINGRCSDF